jgi:hypothetical protein
MLAATQRTRSVDAEFFGIMSDLDSRPAPFLLRKYTIVLQTHLK